MQMDEPIFTDECRVAARKDFFQKVYEECQGPLGTFLYRLLAQKDEAEDLYQEILKKFWLYLQDVQELPTHEGARRWLYTVARNQVRDWYRHWHRRWGKLPSVSLEEGEETPCKLPSVEDRFSEQERLLWAFTQMSPKYRICLVLQDLYGYTQNEIADILGIEAKTVSSNVVTVGMGSSMVQIRVNLVVSANIQPAPPTVLPSPSPTALLSPSPTVLPSPKSVAQPPCITATPTSLAFTAVQGRSNITTQRVALLNSCGAGNWLGTVDQSWLSLSPSSGKIDPNGSVNIDVQVSITNLARGTYTGHIVFSSGSNANVGHLDVTLAVITPQANPCITVDPSQLAFTVEQSGNPGSQNLIATNCGDAGTVTTSGSTKWLSITGGGQMNTSSLLGISVSVNTQGMVAGQYTGYVNVTLTDVNGIIATQQVVVNLTISLPSSSSVTPTPTPLSGSQSFVVTHWVWGDGEGIAALKPILRKVQPL